MGTNQLFGVIKIGAESKLVVRASATKPGKGYDDRVDDLHVFIEKKD